MTSKQLVIHRGDAKEPGIFGSTRTSTQVGKVTRIRVAYWSSRRRADVAPAGSEKIEDLNIPGRPALRNQHPEE